MAALYTTSLCKGPNVVPSLSAVIASYGKIDLICARYFHGTGSLLRKKSEWRLHRRPSNTKLRHDKDELIKERKAFGGRKKVKAIWKNKGTYTLNSQDITLEVPILDVVHSDSNKNHIIKKIMTKGSIIEIDGKEFANRLNAESPEMKEEKNDEVVDSNDQSKQTAKNLIDENLKAMIGNGKLLAKITTKPGQDGLCNGYVLEGTELENLMKKLSINPES